MSLVGRLLGHSKPRSAPAAVADGTRVYAIGDIHGRSDLVAKLAQLVVADLQTAPPRGRVLLIFLGDYVDRGMDSRGVLNGLAQSEFASRAIFLRGNHEAMLLSFLNDPAIGLDWIRNGGLETLHSYGIDVSGLRSGQGIEEAQRALKNVLPPTHVEFLRATRLSFECGDYYFCHAGVRPGVPLRAQREDDLMWIRDEFTKSTVDFGKVIVHGHSPVLHPEILSNRINIDTGAYVSGALTCVVLEGTNRKFLSTRSR